MGKYTPYIIVGIIGVIVLYAIKQMSPEPIVQQVPEFIGSDTISAPSGNADRLAARVNVFNSLASVAQSQTMADIENKRTDAQLQATSIASRIQQYAQESAERLGLARNATEERLATIQAGTIESGQDYSYRMFEADISNRLAQLNTQLQAVQNVGLTYRNQSLERQGTILNAIGQTYGQGAPYDYLSTFGPKTPSIWSQLLNSAVSGASGFFTGGFNQIGGLFGGRGQSDPYGGYRTPPFNPYGR